MEERLPPPRPEAQGTVTGPVPGPEEAAATPDVPAPEPDYSQTEPEDPRIAVGVLRRIRGISVAAYVVFAGLVAITSGFAGLAGLTCSALVVMINFLWLEQIVSSVLQPTPQLKPWKLALRMAARFVLLGAAISVSIYVARFNAFSVLLGFSTVVAGIIGEALYSTYRSYVPRD